MSERKYRATAKLTEEQREEVTALLDGRSWDRFVYEAIRDKAKTEGADWPEYEWSSHGGKRNGAGRPPNSRV